MAPQNYSRANALLEKFFAGECTPEELELLDNWYDSLSDVSAGILPPGDASRQREQFLLDFRGGLAARRIAWWKRPAFRWAAAACILLLAGASYLWINPARHTPAKLVAANYFSVTNETNDARLVTLPDSSRIWLNATASLRWREDFNKQDRSVQLTGEGFFEVNGHEGKPFIIHTRDIAIQVLGTKFNVEAYSGEEITRVSLVQGKLKVRAGKDSTVAAVLKPGFAAAYYNDGAEMNISETQAGTVAAWKTGAFSATDLPFKDAVMRLCIRNGYRVTWQNTQGIDKNISVMFRKEPFTKMLDNLCYINRKQYRISDRQVTIY